MKLKRIFILTLLIIISYILFITILQPSYISTKIACSPNYETDWVTAGQTTINETTNEIEITVLNEEDLGILKHEFIHYRQLQRNENNIYCGSLNIRRYFIEIEAYTGSYLPDFIYKPIYGDYNLGI